MAGQAGKSGRKRMVGTLYRLNVRWSPARHSAELKELLEMLAGMGDAQRRGDILERAASGGVAEAREAVRPEAEETMLLLDDLFNGQ